MLDYFELSSMLTSESLNNEEAYQRHSNGAKYLSEMPWSCSDNRHAEYTAHLGTVLPGQRSVEAGCASCAGPSHCFTFKLSWEDHILLSVNIARQPGKSQKIRTRIASRRFSSELDRGHYI